MRVATPCSVSSVSLAYRVDPFTKMRLGRQSLAAQPEMIGLIDKITPIHRRLGYTRLAWYCPRGVPGNPCRPRPRPCGRGLFASPTSVQLVIGLGRSSPARPGRWIISSISRSATSCREPVNQVAVLRRPAISPGSDRASARRFPRAEISTSSTCPGPRHRWQISSETWSPVPPSVRQSGHGPPSAGHSVQTRLVGLPGGAGCHRWPSSRQSQRVGAMSLLSLPF